MVFRSLKNLFRRQFNFGVRHLISVGKEFVFHHRRWKKESREHLKLYISAFIHWRFFKIGPGTRFDLNGWFSLRSMFLIKAIKRQKLLKNI